MQREQEKQTGIGISQYRENMPRKCLFSRKVKLLQRNQKSNKGSGVISSRGNVIALHTIFAAIPLRNYALKSIGAGKIEEFSFGYILEDAIRNRKKGLL
jgi:hypothetical protein